MDAGEVAAVTTADRAGVAVMAVVTADEGIMAEEGEIDRQCTGLVGK